MIVYPDFKIIANEKDVTSYIKENLMSLSFEDCDGYLSDEVALTVSGVYLRPSLGDTLRVYIGTVGKLYDYGIFKVQTTSIDHKSQITEVRATAINFADKFKTKENQLWENCTLADIATMIAGRNDMKVSVGSSKSVDITSKTQHDESDIVFLRQLANTNGYTCVIKDNTIILSAYGDEEEHQVFDVNIKDCTSLRIDRAAKLQYNSVRLSWQDLDTNQSFVLKPYRHRSG